VGNIFKNSSGHPDARAKLETWSDGLGTLATFRWHLIKLFSIRQHMKGLSHRNFKKQWAYLFVIFCVLLFHNFLISRQQRFPPARLILKIDNMSTHSKDGNIQIPWLPDFSLYNILKQKMYQMYAKYTKWAQSLPKWDCWYANTYTMWQPCNRVHVCIYATNFFVTWKTLLTFSSLKYICYVTMQIELQWTSLECLKS
jgi:hypothetical protein